MTPEEARQYVAERMRNGLRFYIGEINDEETRRRAEEEIVRAVSQLAVADVQAAENKATLARIERIMSNYELRKKYEKKISRLTLQQLRGECMRQFDATTATREGMDKVQETVNELRKRVQSLNADVQHVGSKNAELEQSLMSERARANREQRIVNKLIGL